MRDSILPDSTLHVLGALALELAPGSAQGRDALPQREAGALAALIARDLAGFAPEAAALELVTVGAHYDAVELLRPGWPLHRELDQLPARAPQISSPSPARGGGLGRGQAPAADRPHPDLPAQAGGGEKSGRIIAFGAHHRQLPGTLAPAPEYARGPLRLLPFLLRAPVPGDDAGVVATVGDAFERELLQRGMAGAETALAAQEFFTLKIEHARYLTLHDLAAMMALQYEHAGLAPLWPLIEAALLSPESEEWVDAAPEPLLHYAGREARIALFSPTAWCARYAAGSQDDGGRLERRFEQFQARQRQFSAVLGAHGIPVTFVHCDGDPTNDL